MHFPGQFSTTKVNNRVSSSSMRNSRSSIHNTSSPISSTLLLCSSSTWSCNCATRPSTPCADCCKLSQKLQHLTCPFPFLPHRRRARLLGPLGDSECVLNSAWGISESELDSGSGAGAVGSGFRSAELGPHSSSESAVAGRGMGGGESRTMMASSGCKVGCEVGRVVGLALLDDPGSGRRS